MCKRTRIVNVPAVAIFGRSRVNDDEPLAIRIGRQFSACVPLRRGAPAWMKLISGNTG